LQPPIYQLPRFPGKNIGSMAISSLDTLDISRRLKGAGFSDAQAETVTEIFRDVRSADLANLATKSAIERLGVDIQRLRAELKSDNELLRRDMTIRLGGMIVGGESQRPIEAGISGVTANPATFGKAIGSGSEYAGEMQQIAKSGGRDR